MGRPRTPSLKHTINGWLTTTDESGRVHLKHWLIAATAIILRCLTRGLRVTMRRSILMRRHALHSYCLPRSRDGFHAATEYASVIICSQYAPGPRGVSVDAASGRLWSKLCTTTGVPNLNGNDASMFRARIQHSSTICSTMYILSSCAMLRTLERKCDSNI